MGLCGDRSQKRRLQNMNKQPYLEGLRLHAQRAVESGKSCEQWVNELLPVWREEGRKAYEEATASKRELPAQ